MRAPTDQEIDRAFREAAVKAQVRRGVPQDQAAAELRKLDQAPPEQLREMRHMIRDVLEALAGGPTPQQRARRRAEKIARKRAKA